MMIADDDAVSLCFLCGAVEQAGCAVLAAESADAALELLPSPPSTIDLLLLDRRMPGRDGCALLLALRGHGVEAPAVATSAELDAATERSLLIAGFAATLLKPASVADVHTLLRRFIAAVAIALPGGAAVPAQGLPLLEDVAALVAVGGDLATLRALRELFARELFKIEQTSLRTSSVADSLELAESLHRLRASSGICGARRLRAAVERLAAALRLECADVDDAMQDFLLTCRATRDALAAGSERTDSGQVRQAT